MNAKTLYYGISYLIAAVWLANGLFCKVLNLVPRHQSIVANILGAAYARPLTLMIGIGEVMIALWIISRFRPRLIAVAQMVLVGTMNTIELFAAPHLLLWGPFNSLFAALFIILIYYHEFVLRNRALAKESI